MKSSTIIAIIIALIVIAGGWYWWMHDNAISSAPKDYKNATYIIEGQPITLVNGQAQTASAPGSAAQTVTHYFGNDATGDLNGDGRPDVGFILTQTTGGSGTFYYAVAALNMADGYHGTNAILLGDRIAPQTTEIKDGQLIVNYADRKPDEPMTATPSVGITKYLKVEGTSLVEIQGVVTGGGSQYIEGNLLLGTDATSTLGTYLIGYNGMTLYRYAPDAANISNCSGGCATTWPPYTIASTSALANIQAGITGKVSSIVRADGTMQVTYKGQPLYFYIKDAKSGDTTGQNVGGVWFVVKP